MPKNDSNITPTALRGSVSRKLAATEIGSTGLEQWSGIVNEEWIVELRDRRKYKTYREMQDNDPVIGAILFTIEMLIRQVKWRTVAASDSSEDEAAREFLEECMDDMSHSWENLIGEILSMLPYGFSYHELVYKRRLGRDQKDGSRRSKYTDGKIGWRKIPIRAQNTLDRWIFDDDGGTRAFVQDDPTVPGLHTIPIEKALLFRTSSHKNNPEGRSVLRNAFRPWFFKKRIEEIEGIGIERDLAGLPVIYAPMKIMSASASPDEKGVFTELKNIVRNIRRDEQEGIIMPGGRDDKGNLLYELKLLSSGGSRQFDTNAIVTRYDQRIAMTVLADFILLGHSAVGSHALSDDKTTLFATALGAWLGEIESVFNSYAIPRLFQLNGSNLQDYPRLDHGDLETPDLAKLGEYITKLAGAGATLFPDTELENHLRGAANLPEKPDDE